MMVAMILPWRSVTAVLLFRNLGGGKFADVTKSTGIVPANRPAGLTFVDFDHDGDLDLFVTGEPAGTQPAASSNVLWRNNGNGTFTNWTVETGLGGAKRNNQRHTLRH